MRRVFAKLDSVIMVAGYKAASGHEERRNRTAWGRKKAGLRLTETESARAVLVRAKARLEKRQIKLL